MPLVASHRVFGSVFSIFGLLRHFRYRIRRSPRCIGAGVRACGRRAPSGKEHISTAGASQWERTLRLISCLKLNYSFPVQSRANEWELERRTSFKVSRAVAHLRRRSFAASRCLPTSVRICHVRGLRASALGEVQSANSDGCCDCLIYICAYRPMRRSNRSPSRRTASHNSNRRSAERTK